MTENKNCVSLFKNVRDMNVEMVSIERIFKLITSDLYRDSTEKYRYFVSSGLSKDAEAVKRQAAGFVPSAVCRGGRTEKHVVAYTGFAMADFDDMEPEDFQRCLSLLESDPYVLLAYVTISGKGLRIIYRTDLVDKRFHSFAFTNGNEYFAKLINSAPDLKCKNLTRLSFLAYDPKAIFHPQATPFHVKIDSDSKKPVGRPHLVHNADLSKALPIVLKQLEKQGKTYVTGHYNEYVSAAMYLLNRYGVSLTEASKWALTEFPDYEPSQLQTIATSAYQCDNEFGSMKLPAPSIYSSIDEIEEYVLTQAKIRYNELLGRREICWTGATQYTDLTDSDENTLWIRSLKAGLNSTFHTFLCILDSDFTPIYNPLVDFLQNNEPWDGVTDYISQVSGMVHTTAPELFTLYFKKWIVASIAAILDSNVVNHTILTLLGEQGIYKTTFLNHLLPPELQRYFYTKVNSGYFTKDDQFTLAEFAFICLEEIDSMRPSEVNQIKAMVSAPNINERAAYARNKS
ncbi:MAG: BT4734/BF3469 family protein, partial [Bacteroidaceae bacterium]